MASYLHSLASSSSLDQVPFHPSSPITIPQICEIHPHVLGSALVWGEEGIHEGVDLLQRCDEMVSKLGLFSSNETKEDVSTPTSSSYSYGSPSLLLLEFHLHFMSAFVRLDIGEGKEINLGKCPRSKLQSQCIKYLGPKKKGSFQHSSFLAGGAITAAGRLVVKDGILKAIWPYSGHYLPTEENFRDFVRYLQENGVDLTDVKKCAIDKDDEYQLLSKLDTQPEQNQNNKAAAAATVAEDLNEIVSEDVRTSDTDHGTTDYGDMSEAEEDVATPADSYTTDTEEEEELNDVSEQSLSTVVDRSENHLVVDGNRPRHSVRAGLPAGSPVQGPRARQPLAETHGLAVEEEGPGAPAWG
ncbi:hypothetical protein ACQ4PT_001864 [Festuca glaucescens]